MRSILLLTALILAPLAPWTAHGAEPATQTVTLAVEEMNCAACPITVRKSLEKVAGVVAAKVDYEHKTATVTFDARKTKVEALTQATTEAGYPSKLLK